MIETSTYENFKKECFKSDDTIFFNSNALKLTEPEDRKNFEQEYARSEGLYYQGRPTLDQILARFAKDIERL